MASQQSCHETAIPRAPFADHPSVHACFTHGWLPRGETRCAHFNSISFYRCSFLLVCCARAHLHEIFSERHPEKNVRVYVTLIVAREHADLAGSACAASIDGRLICRISLLQLSDESFMHVIWHQPLAHGSHAWTAQRLTSKSKEPGISIPNSAWIENCIKERASLDLSPDADLKIICILTAITYNTRLSRTACSDADRRRPVTRRLPSDHSYRGVPYRRCYMQVKGPCYLEQSCCCPK